MKNLAGIAECDMFITIELARCGIEAVPGERTRNEVPASVTGRLGAFTFRRAWYYWVAEGPFPLDVASRLYESELVWASDVRADGHCGAHHPRERNVGASTVRTFHIDSELGLRLFADAVRALGKP